VDAGALSKPKAPASTVRSMGHRFDGRLLYVGHRDAKVRTEDWEEMVRDLENYLATNKYLSVLVKTGDAGPDAAQRRRVHEVVTAHGGTLKVGVMSSSVFVRGIITAISWARIMDIRSFGPDDYSAALAFLDMPQIRPQEAANVFATIQRNVI
jgi:hypothetical protein